MVRPKKYLGQHFLRDQTIARKVVESLSGFGDYKQVLEIGPGTGVLTRYLLEQAQWNTWMIDIDAESIHYLKEQLPNVSEQLINENFLTWDAASLLPTPFAVIGNFPFNISSQILFRILELRQLVPEVVCMLQKEVAQRLVSPPGNRTYGILSVFLQAYYQLEYLFEVPPECFYPSPKVHSAVIRLKSLGRHKLDCDERIFRILVKRGFQNRRKTLRNALKEYNLPEEIRTLELLGQRAEQLAVDDYVSLTKTITPFWNL
jgi:16S rRNA (adenine1518-N6/adenine1519-N6)-dimethyltransferase